MTTPMLRTVPEGEQVETGLAQRCGLSEKRAVRTLVERIESAVSAGDGAVLEAAWHELYRRDVGTAVHMAMILRPLGGGDAA